MRNTQRTHRKEARKSNTPETSQNGGRVKQQATDNRINKQAKLIMSTSVRSSSISSTSRKRRPSSNSALKGSKQDAVVAEVKAPISNLSNIRQLCWTGLDGLQPQQNDSELDESIHSTGSTIVLPGSATPPSYHRATFWKLLLGYIPINMVKRNAALRKKRSEYLDMANDQTKKLQLLFGDEDSTNNNYYDYCCSHWGQQREKQEQQQRNHHSSHRWDDDHDDERPVSHTTTTTTTSTCSTGTMTQATTATTPTNDNVDDNDDDCCGNSKNSSTKSSNNSSSSNAEDDDESSLSDIEFEGGGSGSEMASSMNDETNEDDSHGHHHATYHHQEEWIMNLFDNHLLARQVCLDVRRVNPSITMGIVKKFFWGQKFQTGVDPVLYQNGVSDGHWN